MADRGLLEFKVVVLGDKGVGKTCLVLRFIEVSRPPLCAVQKRRLEPLLARKLRSFGGGCGCCDERRGPEDVF
jgi:hypothetical protein